MISRASDQRIDAAQNDVIYQFKAGGETTLDLRGND